MASVSRSYTFTDGTDAYGSQVENELNTIFNAWNNHDAGTSTWTVLNGTTIKRAGTTIIPILQVTQVTTVTNSTTTSSTYQSTALTGSITPGSTSNKILVLSAFSGASANAATRATYAIFNGSTNLQAAVGGGSLNPVIEGHLALFALDSPASVSAQTYTIKMKSSDNTNSVAFLSNSQTATLLLIELGY